MQSHDHVCQIDFLKKNTPKQKYLCPNPPVFPCDIFFFLLYYLSKITVDGSVNDVHGGSSISVVNELIKQSINKNMLSNIYVIVEIDLTS